MKKFLVSLFLLVVIVCIVGLVVSLFLPSAVHVERSITVDAPAATVFPLVNNLKNWQKWSPWYKLEPTAKYVYQDVAEGAGASYSWQGAKVGEGSMEITESVDNESIEMFMDFGSQGTATGSFLLVSNEEGQTEVTWDFDTKLGWNPIAKFFGLFMDSMLGKDFELGLSDIKAVAESMAIDGDAETLEEASQAISTEREDEAVTTEEPPTG